MTHEALKFLQDLRSAYEDQNEEAMELLIEEFFDAVYPELDLE